jgi:uncharacterized repeat protein (TIGR01451 family)
VDFPDIRNCQDFVTTHEGCDDVDFFPVFYDLVEFRGLEYSAHWPGSYSCAFTSCSDLKIGDIIWPGDGLSHAWYSCQLGPVAIPGWGWLSVNEPGLICVGAHPATGSITVGDCDALLDNLGTTLCAGVCGAEGTDPCGGAPPTLDLIKDDGLAGGCEFPGHYITYRILYTTDSQGADNARIFDYLPDETEFVAASRYGSYSPSQHRVSWTLGDLPGDVADSVKVKVRIRPETPIGILIVNTCSMVCDGLMSKMAAESTMVCTEGLEPLSLSIDDGLADECEFVGHYVTYRIIYATDQQSAVNVRIMDYLADETEFFYATDQGSYNSNEHTVTWMLGDLPAGLTDSVKVKVRIRLDTPAGASLVSSCSVFSDGAPRGQAAESTMVCTEQLEPLSLTKDDGLGHRSVIAGDNVSYSIRYGNGNAEDLHGVTIVDYLPPELSFVSASHGGTYGGANRSVTWNLGTMVGGATDSVELVTSVRSDLEDGYIFTNTCEVWSDETRSVRVTERTGVWLPKVAVHVLPDMAGRSCSNGFPEIRDCSKIDVGLAGCGYIHVFPVFFDVPEYQGFSYSMSWPSEWGDMVFTSCSDVTLGSITRPFDGIEQLWNECRPGTIVIPGYGEVIARGPGYITVTGYPGAGPIGITSCSGVSCEVGESFPAGVCGAQIPDPPCGGPTVTRPATWGSIKALFRD